MKKPESELLKLLNARHRELGLGEKISHSKPQWTAVQQWAIDQAARRHAQAHRSDPWAFGRAKLHMMQGYELVSEVVRDANALLGAQGRQR